MRVAHPSPRLARWAHPNQGAEWPGKPGVQVCGKRAENMVGRCLILSSDPVLVSLCESEMSAHCRHPAQFGGARRMRGACLLAVVGRLWTIAQAKRWYGHPAAVVSCACAAMNSSPRQIFWLTKYWINTVLHRPIASGTTLRRIGSPCRSNRLGTVKRKQIGALHAGE